MKEFVAEVMKINFGLEECQINLTKHTVQGILLDDPLWEERKRAEHPRLSDKSSEYDKTSTILFYITLCI